MVNAVMSGIASPRHFHTSGFLHEEVVFMADIPESTFLHIYGEFLIDAWGNPPLKNKFMKDPGPVLKAYGLDPEGAKVNVISPGSKNVPATQCTPESAAKMWNDGKKKGSIDFVFPETPPAEFASQELSDQELMAVAGGASGCSKYCCCCTPCCCC
jgi:hypothetical protein